VPAQGYRRSITAFILNNPVINAYWRHTDLAHVLGYLLEVEWSHRDARASPVSATAPPKGCAMTEEKKLSDDELKDVAGGTKNWNSSKSNTSKVGKKDDAGKDPKRTSKPGEFTAK